MAESNDLRRIRRVLSGIRVGLEMRYVRPDRRAETNEQDLAVEYLLQLERIRLLTTRRSLDDDITPILPQLETHLMALIRQPGFAELATHAPFRWLPTSTDTDDLFLNELSNKSVLQALHAVTRLISSLSLSSNNNRPEELDVKQLRSLIPAQKIAPAQFEIVKHQLVILNITNTTRAADRANIQAGRQELLRNGDRILKELQHSNCDKRLLESVMHVNELLAEDGNIINLGLSTLGCAIMCDNFKAELPTAVAAMLDSYTRGLELYAGQFPEWNRFLENAAVAQLSDDDVDETRKAVTKVVEELKNRKDLVHPAVPQTLTQLNNLLRHPGATAKRAAFALLRSMENLISRIFQYGTDFLDGTAKKVVDQGSSVASKAIVVTLLTLALHSVGALSPVTSKLNEMGWLKNAAELVEKQIKRMTTD